MIVNNNSSGIVTTSGITGEAIRIKASGKFYKAMLDSIYQDKPGSIVRELATNALDAHRVAGNTDRPFIIHLPDTYEPYFSVRDFGCSMTHEQMMNVYCVMFESSKDNDNTQAGGYGIGGKNFLSYQDSGTIVTYLDGIKRTYVLMYDESGLPKVYLMAEESTEEENGVYVEVAIKDNDFHHFHKAVSEQLKFFKVKPILNNNSFNTVIHTPTFKEDYGKFKVFDDNFDNPRGFWIVQGEVGYPVNMDEIKNKLKNKDNLEFFNAFSCGVLEFDIGEILVTASRENIQYDSHTIQSIEKFIGEVAPIISKNIFDKLKGIATSWDKIKYLNSNPDIAKISKLANIDLELDKVAKYSSSTNHYFVDVTALTRNDLTIFNFVSGKRKYFDKKGAIIHPKDNVEILIRDVGRGAIARLKQYQYENPHKTLYVIEHRDGYDKFTSDIRKDIYSVLCGLVPISLNSLPVPPKTNKAARSTPIVYKWSAGKSLDSISGWERIYDEEDIENGYYVTFTAYPHINIDNNIKNIVKIANSSNVLSDSIYAIKNSKEDIFKENINMIKLQTKIEDLVQKTKEKYKNKSYINRYIQSRFIYSDTKTHIVHSFLKFFNGEMKDKLITTLGRDHAFSKIFRYHESSYRIYNKIKSKHIDKLSPFELALFNELCMEYKHNQSLSFDVDKYYEKYPALEWVKNTWSTPKLASSILDYIILVDSVDSTNKV